MLSIVIPANKEIYLQETIDDVLVKAAGEIEIIVTLDGYWPRQVLKDDRRLTLIHRDRRGMRDSINDAIRIAKGEYIMKLDAHCMMCEGFDEILLSEIEDNWIVVPRRYGLDAKEWRVRTDKDPIDYEYLAWPYNWKFMKSGRHGMHGMPWDERTNNRIDRTLDENMTFQGSCWVMAKEHFIKRIGWMDSTNYYTFSSEAQELGMPTWLGGGKIITNKRAWYAHLWKGHGYVVLYREMFGERYARQGRQSAKKGQQYTIDYWLHRTDLPYKHRSIDWLIERFWPVPGWPSDPAKWREIPKDYKM